MIAAKPVRPKGASDVSVIGRLDGQVEEVLIKPVGRRRAPDETSAPEIAPESPATERGGPRATRPADPPETPRDGGGLPVCLL